MARRSEAAVAAPISSKREAILTAAQALFLEAGYAATSMDAVAARAGVSKATIYAHFAGKEDLFGALIAGRCDACFGHLEAPDLGGRSVREALVELGRNFFDVVTTAEAIGMFRVVAAEAARFPEVGRAFYEAGPRRGLDAIARFLGDLTRRGLLDVPDPRLAAEFFVGMLRSDAYLVRLLGLPDRRPRDQVVDHAVEVLLRAYAPRAG